VAAKDETAKDGAATSGDTMLKVTQVRSQIGTKPKTRGTLRALGLRRLGDSNVLPDRPEIRGMLHRVPHLVRIEEVEGGARRTAGPTSPEGED
jgi:large subunit ribosomal protein L30